MLWYVNSCNLFKQIEHVFPIRGHSFMPPDRLFGRTEKIMRKKETMLTSNDYHNIFRDHATVKILNQDWKVWDFNSISKNIIKRKLTFKILDQRVLIYNKGVEKIQT